MAKDVRRCTGRGRTCRHRYGDRCRLERSPLDDIHLRSGPEPDDRIRRPCLLRRSTGCCLGCPAHRPFDRSANPYFTGRPDFYSFMGHGDTQTIILLPGDVFECFEFGWKAFDVAERMQTPVFVLSDLDMGMNQWMSKPFEYPDVPMDRGKVSMGKGSRGTQRQLGALSRQGWRWHSLPHLPREQASDERLLHTRHRSR